VTIWTLAAYASRPVSMLGCGTVLATWLTQWLTGAGAYFRYARWPTILYLLFWASAFWAWGRSARRVRAAHAAELAAQAERLERDRELEAQRAVAAERTRIARELHDVVAHHVSVMVVQAGAARRRPDDDPEQTRAALAAVEAAGRAGLEAMPGLLRALGPTGTATAWRPSRPCESWAGWSPRWRRPASRSSCASRAPRGPCRPRSTCLPTGSPRRPSPTSSSTPAKLGSSWSSATARTPWS
jgi:Histidine kinase